MKELDRKQLHSLKQLIIGNVINPKADKSGYFWGREMKILDDLLVKYPNSDFWQKFKPDYQPFSLAFYKTKEGNNFLRRRFDEFHYNIVKKQKTAKEEPEFTQEFRGSFCWEEETRERKPLKPKTLSQFLTRK